ncbi:WXG100 family type VII secretion target [Nocardia wallacei]|uniref:WXG100 family type VII secretion target n=1 Tax=Nocardia wallacei TaxID=480035 RepID=UPI002454EAE3|nr:WXG100 family type VII secretion target [Nocardia wallacei]
MTDFGELSYNFGAIQEGGDGIERAAKDITSTLGDMEKRFQTFINSAFGGQGAEAFDQVQRNWSLQSNDLTAALSQLGARTISAGEAMHGADVLAAKIIAG